MSSSTTSEIRALEHSTLKVPYEVLNKKFRIAQKSIDREAARVGDTANELEKILKQPVVHVHEIDALVQALIDKLGGLKRKATDALSDESESAVVLKKRIDHLKIYSEPASTPMAIQHWRQKRIERQVVDYLLRAGYYDTACKFAAHVGIEYLTNLGVFAAAKEVVEALKRHELSKCLEWCYENRSKLRRTKSTLELRVREQEFIELIRRGQYLDAVRYARKYFGQADIDQWKKEDDGITHVMGLLAVSPEKNLDRYRHLLAPSRWDELIEEFREENFRLYQLNTQSVFSACLQSGLSSMKTPKCFSCAVRDTDMQTAPNCRNRAADCPVCVPEAKALATTLPYAHASHSRLVCAYSGEPMNENNPPFVLPNGMVYGQNSLIAIAAENDGKVVCPRTKVVFSLKEAERVYVM